MIDVQERRRFPRRAVTADVAATVPVGVRVRLLDISVAGVLLASSQSVRAGERGRLSVNLEGTPLQVELQVRRVTPAGAAAADYSIGGALVGMTDHVRRLIERFVMH